jgi:hypothetical protein
LTAEVLVPLVDSLDAETRILVANYLAAGTTVLALMGYTEDVLEGRFGVSGGSAVLTDGRYFWRRDAADYVREYGIGVDAEPMAFMQQQNWTPPTLEAERVLEIDQYLFAKLRGRS